MEEALERELHDLGREVAGYEREYLTRHSGLERLRTRSPAQITRRAAWSKWSLLVPALSVAGVLGVWWSTTRTTLTFAVGNPAVTAVTAGHTGQVLSARADKLPVRFSDGSLVELARGAEARVAELDSDGATVRIDEGQAEVSVRHRAHTHWKFQAGPFEVRVTGTRFTIGWDRATEAVTVAMREGSVEILSRHLAGSSAVRVTAGERFFSSRRQARWTIEAANGAPSPSPTATAARSAPEAPPPAGEVPSAPATSPTPAVRPSVRDDRGVDKTAPPETAIGVAKSERIAIGGTRHWQVLAALGHYQDALELVERSEGFATTCRRLGSEPLVQLGDVARLAGNSARAEQAYHLARKRFPRSDRPIFGLGLVAFEQRQDYPAAAYWFERYRQQFPSGPLTAEAVGRAMESWHRAGDPARAVAGALAYLKIAPAGPYAPLARQIANP
jgi:transmembrane sensor